MTATNDAEPTADLVAEFAECCGYQRWFIDERWITKQVAVDNLQFLAEHGGYVGELGQDEVQGLMAEAFTDLPNDYAAALVMRWEMADPRDRWQWVGELPPAPEPTTAPVPAYRTPPSVVDAFWVVLRRGDPDYLARWLLEHPRDASFLKQIWQAKCNNNSTIAA
jgi:hypothetical protein